MRSPIPFAIIALCVSLAGCAPKDVDKPAAPAPVNRPVINTAANEYDATCTVFFPQGTASIDDVAKQLDDYSVAAKRNGDVLYITGNFDCQFKLELVTGSHVLEEAKEIAAGTPHEQKMKSCDARIEIAIEHLDKALDEINTLLEIQAAVQEATQGILFLPWNGELAAPEKG